MLLSELKKLLGLIWQYWNPDESDLYATDPARYISGIETDFNQHYADTIEPSSKLMADESMCFYLGAVGDTCVQPFNSKLLFHQDYIPRKPRTTGKEVKDAGDVASKMLIRIEAQRGKALHVKQKYYEEYGHTVAQQLRLLEPWFNSGRTFAADSWFIGFDAVEVLLDHGIYGFGDVKTNTSRFPTKYIQEHCGTEPGDWVTLTTEDVKGRPIYAVGNRHGPSVRVISRSTI